VLSLFRTITYTS